MTDEHAGKSNALSLVIHAADRFAARRSAHQPATIAPATDEDTDGEAPAWTPEQIRRIFAPSVRALPFVSLSDENPFGPPLSYWNDVPTEDFRTDFKRGRHYADMTISAIDADDCGSFFLGHIIGAMVKDAIARKSKGGRYSRTLPPAVSGFFYQLTHRVCGRKAPRDQ
jgi:hypothetical protein